MCPCGVFPIVITILLLSTIFLLSPAPGLYADTMLTLILDRPPSENHLYPTGKTGRRFLSPEGKRYYAALPWSIRLQLDGPITTFVCRLSVSVVVHRPDRRRRDIVNLWKALADGLTHAGIWDDDSQIEDARIRWGSAPIGKAIVEISPL